MPVCRTLTTLLALAVAACTGVTTAGGQRLALTSKEFSSYMESVFREQNELLTEIAFVLDREDLSDIDRGALEVAEESLLVACERINEVAATRRDGQDPGRIRESRAARAAPSCERAAVEARTVLNQMAAIELSWARRSSAAWARRLPGAPSGSVRRESP